MTIRPPERHRSSGLAGDVQQIRTKLSTMFDLVDEQLASALNVIQTGDLHLAQEVRKRDDQIDQLEMDIDRLAEAALVSRPDKPSTIRFIMAALKVNTDLERIGDHCRNIAKSAGTVDRSMVADLAGHFDEMILGVRTMLYAAQDALFTGDLSKAWELVHDGHHVGRLHSETLGVIVASTRSGFSDYSFETGARLYALSKALERIADHSVNIAESVLFWEKGIDVRHPRSSEVRDIEHS